MAELPEKRLLGLHQYKAPPAVARVARSSNSSSPAVSSGDSAFAGEDYERIEGVEEHGFLSEGNPMPAPSEGEDGMPGGEAEAAALADARGRGEAVAIATALNQVEEETTKKKLPELREVLPLIPPGIHEALDDIFRAKWMRIVRVKKRDLFQP